MNTSELIEKLFASLKTFGDLPTNIRNISWFCPKESGNFEEVHLHTEDEPELENQGE